MDVKKLVSSFALSAMILASLIGVCTHMIVSCGLNCTEQSIGVMRMDGNMVGCTQNSSACSTSMTDHMRIFASIYPSVTSNAVALLLVVVVAFFLTRPLIAHAGIDGHEKLRVKLRSLRERISKTISPDFLVFAFSQGILNSKIYASS